MKDTISKINLPIKNKKTLISHSNPVYSMPSRSAFITSFEILLSLLKNKGTSFRPMILKNYSAI